MEITAVLLSSLEKKNQFFYTDKYLVLKAILSIAHFISLKGEAIWAKGLGLMITFLSL